MYDTVLRFALGRSRLHCWSGWLVELFFIPMVVQQVRVGAHNAIGRDLVDLQVSTVLYNLSARDIVHAYDRYTIMCREVGGQSVAIQNHQQKQTNKQHICTRTRTPLVGGRG